MKKALIIGANGQDASYLSELLLGKGYILFGSIRRNSVPESQTTRIQDLHKNKKIILKYADLTDPSSIEKIIYEIRPDEIYHLGAQSHVQISFDLPRYTLDVNAGGTLSILESVRKFSSHSKIYNASSSEMFGNSCDPDGYQRETTPMIPVSPYGCSKLFAHSICRNYRNAYGMFVCSGILFNHESPKRGINFVTNKIVLGAVKIKMGIEDNLCLGNLEARRDWGHAKDFVNAIWMMLQQEKPDDYVVSTGETRSVRQLVEYVFGKLDISLDKVVIGEAHIRPEELNYLKGDSSKIRKLGWVPTYTFDKMIDEMIDYWLARANLL